MLEFANAYLRLLTLLFNMASPYDVLVDLHITVTPTCVVIEYDLTQI